MHDVSEAEVLRQIEAFYNYVDEEDANAGPAVVLPDGGSEDRGLSAVAACTQFPGGPATLPGWLREEACDD